MFNFLSKLSNLQQRLIVGLAGATIILLGICINEWSFLFTFTIISFFSIVEFHALINAAGIPSNKKFGIFIGMLLFWGSFAITNGYLGVQFYKYLPFLLFLFFLVELFQNNAKPFERTAFGILAILYTAVPYMVLNHIVFTEGVYHYEIILGIILLLWANDTGGYFGGRFFGKHKLYERVSPKKTWEGSFSGGLFSLATAYALYSYTNQYSLLFWLGLSLIIVIAGSMGDLVESQFKRSLNIKDSGSSLPGHGGFLDRFDGLIVALPFILLYFELW